MITLGLFSNFNTLYNMFLLYRQKIFMILFFYFAKKLPYISLGEMTKFRKIPRNDIRDISVRGEMKRRPTLPEGKDGRTLTLFPRRILFLRWPNPFLSPQISADT